MLGGFNIQEDGQLEPKIVEIDESKFLRRKHPRGRYHEGTWVFGGIERGTKNCFLEAVPVRDAPTLLPLIERWILPGTRIVSDDWGAYNTIDQIGGGIYSHDVVIHQHHFVDPDDRSIHTNSVESMWARAKRKFKQNYGTSDPLFGSYLVEFMWRQKYGNNFSTMLLHISQQYPL